MIVINEVNPYVLKLFREFENNEEDNEYIENMIRSFMELNEQDV